MTTTMPDKDEVLNAIRDAARTLGRAPSRAQFKSASGMSEYQILKHFPSWRDAVRAAGLEPDSTNPPLEPSIPLHDWGEMIRRERRIPTRDRLELRVKSRFFMSQSFVQHMTDKERKIALARPMRIEHNADDTTSPSGGLRGAPFFRRRKIILAFSQY